MGNLSGEIRTGINLTYTPTDEIGRATFDILTATNEFLWGVVNGTGAAAAEADLAFSDQRTLAGGANEELDLYGGLTDMFGATLNFARIKLIYIYAATANGDSITVGNASSNVWQGPFGGTTETQDVEPGGVFFAALPSLTAWAVSNGSADKLKILNNDGSQITYDIVLVGSSA